jgi:serine/threonine protein kinase
MAPEVMRAGNNKFYDEKADIWSAGVIFYELIYGK